ncbi:Tubulin alpha-3 chain [Senna tora]|uniref:Tubulin alpha-3 chain n=1 Tax=Senna tora TaxID=362788 RepID=A0A834VYZ9_9FABA|nr:Tubulin alpha-3 chain [Senna tora]
MHRLINAFLDSYYPSIENTFVRFMVKCQETRPLAVGDDALNTFFISRKHVPRALFVDLEPIMVMMRKKLSLPMYKSKDEHYNEHDYGASKVSRILICGACSSAYSKASRIDVSTRHIPALYQASQIINSDA